MRLLRLLLFALGASVVIAEVSTSHISSSLMLMGLQMIDIHMRQAERKL